MLVRIARELFEAIALEVLSALFLFIQRLLVPHGDICLGFTLIFSPRGLDVRQDSVHLWIGKCVFEGRHLAKSELAVYDPVFELSIWVVPRVAILVMGRCSRTPRTSQIPVAHLAVCGVQICSLGRGRLSRRYWRPSRAWWPNSRTCS